MLLANCLRMPEEDTTTMAEEAVLGNNFRAILERRLFPLLHYHFFLLVDSIIFNFQYKAKICEEFHLSCSLGPFEPYLLRNSVVFPTLKPREVLAWPFS
ncbi:unnamed protein product [Protopolystoma xenopodis]|uniref:Uncharacterized protein n=1 Tax=Protopolystoma xenopodis TaxID=117903 RepID=A0A3S5AZI6_9PLAT|nr:unnamed protein product [Protopolystoma xenopodis]